MSFGARAKARRLNLGLTQEQLARKARLSLNTIRNIESGRRGGEWKTLQRIAKALGILEELHAESREAR